MSSALWWLVAALVIAPALAVVLSRDLVRSVYWFTFLLLSIALLYATLEAPFLAGIQALTYVGGVVTLMIFGVMVTQRAEGAKVAIDHADQGLALAVSGTLFALLATAIVRSDLPAGEPAPMATAQELAQALVDRHLLAFEVLSVLLLAVLIGAVVLARKRDPAPRDGKEQP